MNLTKFDLLDRISAYSFQRKTIHKKGHEIEYSAVAMNDIEKSFQEFMNENDFFRIISEEDCEEVQEVDILRKKFVFNKEVSEEIKVYNSGDYLLYFNFKLETMTIYELDAETNLKNAIVKKSKIKNKLNFEVIMESLGF